MRTEWVHVLDLRPGDKVRTNWGAVLVLDKPYTWHSQARVLVQNHAGKKQLLVTDCALPIGRVTEGGE